MKKITITTLLFLFIFPLCTFGQAAPFSVQKIGEKGSPILFIPGLACSAEVWQDTVKEFSPNHICYLFTMAGFAGVTPVKNPSLENWAEAIISYIKKEKSSSLLLLGTVWGECLL